MWLLNLSFAVTFFAWQSIWCRAECVYVYIKSFKFNEHWKSSLIYLVFMHFRRSFRNFQIGKKNTLLVKLRKLNFVKWRLFFLWHFVIVVALMSEFYEALVLYQWILWMTRWHKMKSTWLLFLFVMKFIQTHCHYTHRDHDVLFESNFSSF